MLQKLKSIFSLLVLTLCFSSEAQERWVENGNVTSLSNSSKFSEKIDYGQYLSEAGKREIAIKITRSRIAERIKNGTLFDDLSNANEVGSLTIPVTFTKDMDFSKDVYSGEQHQTNTVSGYGNVRCWDLQADTPHIGLQFPNFPSVPKAKASGKCEYIHGGGTPPPWVDFELQQVLIRIPTMAYGLETEYVAFHRQQGLSVEWYPNAPDLKGTQVFGRCPSSSGEYNAIFINDFQIEIYAAPGWTYNGPRPFATVSQPRTKALSC